MKMADGGDDLLIEGLSVYMEMETPATGAESGSGSGSGAKECWRLRDVKLRLRPGEWLTVVGVNGSGKSTLARVLAGLPVEGAVGAMRRGFAGEHPAAYVMQQPDAQLFGETPREELAFALEWRGVPAAELDGRAAHWLERAGLATLADEPWRRLSGGQRQLAAVAAAAAGGAPLVVLDEATAMLDAAAAARVLAMARELQAEGAAIVWVTQRLEELAPDMRVAALREGRLAFDGDARTFLYGREPLREEPPCARCGLRLPYLAELALALLRSGSWEPALPLPMTAEEWQSRLTPTLRTDSDPVFGCRSTPAPVLDGTEKSHRLDDEPPAANIGLTFRGSSSSDQPASGVSWELELRPGEIAVLLGANGAGKTSLLEIAAGLRDPEGLDVAYGGKALWWKGRRGKRRLSQEALLRYAYASQSPEELLVRRTAEEELRVVLRPYRLREQEQAERMAAALATVGWDASWLRKDPYRMSGGERRRLALACLFAVPADWLLADESTAGLDAAGQRLIGEQLRRLRQAGAGVLLASHDSEWALPLADRVLLLSPQGALRSCSREELLDHPEWWAEAGLEVPDWLKTIIPLLQEEAGRANVWSPAAFAREVSIRLMPRPVLAIGSSDGHEARAIPRPSDIGTADNRARPTRSAARPARETSRRIDSFRPRLTPTRGARDDRSPLTGFDPRSVWLSYVLLSLAIFSRHSWRGLALAAIATAAAVLLSRLPLRRWRGLIAGFAVFSLTVSLIAGIGAGGTFAAEASLRALLSMAQTMLVMLLGFGLALAITPLRLRRSLEQLLSYRGRQPFAVQRFILTVTLMLRFIPMFLGEWTRFSRYAVARGKESALSLRSAPRRLKETALPFLLALFRLGDQAADALESRGVGRRQAPTLRRTLRWRLRDTALALGSLAAAALLRLWG